MDFRVLSTRTSVAVSVANPLCHYRIAYRRAYALFTWGLLLKKLRFLKKNFEVFCVAWSISTLTLGLTRTVDYKFICKSQLTPRKLTSGPFLEQSWSRDTQILGAVKDS